MSKDILEQNVSTLLEGSEDAPRIDGASRAKIRATLIAKHTVTQRARSPWLAVGFGVAAAAAAAAVIVTRGGGDQVGSATAETTLADGSTWIAETGAKVTVLGPRHVRVEGAALLDVVPGKGTFVVETARGRVEVLGTKFLVAADATRTTAAVVRGEVMLASDGGNVTLHAGEQGVAEAGRPPVRGPAPRLSHLVSWAAAIRHKDEHQLPVHHGTLFARDPGVRSHPPWGNEYPLPIAVLGVDIVVENQVARIAIDQTFHNETDQVLEGTYRFAIPPDAALQRLAMYVDGKLMESGVVERMQARRIYEELVYRRVDPALLEWAGTGRLNLRIYPIPARQDKRLMLAYTQSLPKLYEDWTITVPFPEVDTKVGELGFDVRIKDCTTCELSSTSHQIAQRLDGNDMVVTYRAHGADLGDSLVIHVRDARHGATIATHTDDTGAYELVRAPADLQREVQAYRKRTWVILDDVSASRDAMARRAQADLIDAFCRELDENDQVGVIAFDVTARTTLRLTRVLDVDRKALRTALAAEGDVGATDFGAALDAAAALLAGTAPDDANIVYLGDGVITSGTRKLDELRTRLAGKAHFIGVGVGDGPDTQTLDALAAATGGYATTMDLADDLGWRAFDLVAALHTARVTNLDARLVDGANVPVAATVYVRSPQVADGEELELVAKLLNGAKPSRAILTGTLDGRPWQRVIELADAKGGAGYLPRMWAQRHIAARLLEKHEPVNVPPCAEGKPCRSEGEVREARDEAIRQDVVALGKRYFLLSRHTSLLVLENDAMYAQYGVEKGSGKTWAPYVMPLTIPVVTTAIAAVPAGMPEDAELERTPLQIFYNPGYAYNGLVVTRGGFQQNEVDLPMAVSGPTTRWQLGLAEGRMGKTAELKLEADVTKSAGDAFDGTVVAALDKSVDAQQIVTASTGSFDRRASFHATLGHGSGTGYGYGVGGGAIGLRGKRGGYYQVGGQYATQVMAQRMTYPTDPAFDDLTAWIPALSPDDGDGWRHVLRDGGGASPHAIDSAATAILGSAHAAIAAGLYRWDELEIAVDSAHRFGWKRTTEAGLGETASFDGKTFTRRYGELDLDVTRTLGDDDIALDLAYLPILIAEPAHWARWFDVAARGTHAVTLSRGGKLALVVDFDDRHHLVSIADADGREILHVAWTGDAPTAARIHGEPIAVGFTADPIDDATAWAQRGTTTGIVVELPGHVPTYWQAKLAQLREGDTEWRRVHRQLMVAWDATTNPAAAFASFEALRTHGGVELGDLVLASGWAVNSKAALAQFKDQPIARHLAHQVVAGEGLVGGLSALRQVVTRVQGAETQRAAEAVLAMGQRAPVLRLIAASALTNTYDGHADLIAKVWDTLATGRYRNIARAMAAQVFVNRGNAEPAVERIAALASDYDLSAAPASFEWAVYMFQLSRRGAAGWQISYATMRDRVLDGGDYAHVMGLLQLAMQHPPDASRVLARAADLAQGDLDRLVEVAQVATAYGQAGLADSILTPLVTAHPTRVLHQLVAQIALAQGRTGEALDHLEAAQSAGADEAVNVATMRGELGQIIDLARQLALSSSGPARDAAVARALAWAKKWRAIDPGNSQIDQAMGELFLATGNKTEAWRQLSGVIERDPWSGTGYQLVAETYERQGRVVESLEFWQQAIVIDQTNPTPRLRKAQALIALGKVSEGDAILHDIVGRKWHDLWQGIVYQATDLLARGKANR